MTDPTMKPSHAFAAIVTLMPATTVTTAWVLVTLWRWFVVPAFGLPELHLAVAVGIMALVFVLRPNQPAGATGDHYRNLVQAVSSFVTRIVLGLGVGWIALQFAPYA